MMLQRQLASLGVQLTAEEAAMLTSGVRADTAPAMGATEPWQLQLPLPLLLACSHKMASYRSSSSM